MSIEMVLAISDESIAQDILEGYRRTGGKNWSRIALSAGRDWSSKENAGLVAFFVNKHGLGTERYVKELDITLIGRDDETEQRVIRNMDKYVTEESSEYGTIAFWAQAPHIHAWFDRLCVSLTGEHMNSYVKLSADVFHELRDDCVKVLDTDKKEGRDAAMRLIQEIFPLTGAKWEMFSSHVHTQKHFDDLEQTRMFFDYLFTLDGAEDAVYAYDPWF